MKLKQIKQLGEMMQPDEITKEIDKLAIYAEKELKKIFPEKDDWVVIARSSTNLGTSFTIDVHEKDYANNIVQNAKYRIHLMMHLTTNFGKFEAMDSFEIEKLSITSQLLNAGVQFRKIKAKTPMEVGKKVVAWFKKNEKKIKESATPDPKVIIKKLLKYLPISKEDKKLKEIPVVLARREATALGMDVGETIILQKLPEDDLYRLAKAYYIM